MNANAELFDIEFGDEVIILTPQAKRLEVNGDALKAESCDLLQHLDTLPARKVVIDFGQTDDCDSSGLGFCMRLWKQLRSRQGGIVLCNVSERIRDTLRVTNLDRLWPICFSREEALAYVAR